MAKASRNGKVSSSEAKSRKASPTKTAARAAPPKASARMPAEPTRAGWATDLVFDVREPKLAVSLRLDADVLRFFRGFGSGYQTRINEVLKAFMQARGGSEAIGHAVVGARAVRASNGNGKRASR